MVSKKKNFLLLSLEDSKAKKVANVVNNESCTKIIDYLTEKVATESQIGKELGIAGSTINYNLKQLMEANLIVVEKTTYSNKGKEVKHYTVANKYIIIAPKGTSKEDFLDKIRGILPALGMSVFGALGLMWFNKVNTTSMSSVSSLAMKKVQDSDMIESSMIQEEGFDMALRSEPVNNILVESTSYLNNYEIAMWFFIGCVFSLVFVVLFRFIRKK